MTVKQLREALAGHPDDMDVHLVTPGLDFEYSSLESVRQEEVLFYDEAFPETCNARDTVVILDIIEALWNNIISPT